MPLWFGLFGQREIQRFYRIKRDQKGQCGTYFTFIHLYGLLVPLLLEEFQFQFYNIIGQWFVIHLMKMGGFGYVSTLSVEGVLSL